MILLQCVSSSRLVETGPVGRARECRLLARWNAVTRPPTTPTASNNNAPQVASSVWTAENLATDDDERRTLDRIKPGVTMFVLEGERGVGKSLLLRHFVATHCRKAPAPTPRTPQATAGGWQMLALGCSGCAETPRRCFSK